MIKIKISRQRLYFYEKKLIKSYPVSTSKFGIGNMAESNKTPLGLHRVAEKIGKNAPIGTIFKERKNTRKIVPRYGFKSDLITTRILRLEGLEKGINKGKKIDSFHRFIYIHGTPEEKLIGKPASRGCIRMRNRDVAQLFDLVKKGTLVKISI